MQKCFLVPCLGLIKVMRQDKKTVRSGKAFILTLLVYSGMENHISTFKVLLWYLRIY